MLLLSALLAATAPLTANGETRDPGPAAPVAAPERIGFDRAALHELDRGLSQAVVKGEVPGLTYLLVRHGKVVAFNSFGQASPARNIAQTNETIFRIFSMTKPITGAAMMVLYEEGKWKLNDPISKFLPEFANLRVLTGVDAAGHPITEPAKRPPTMRELMSHTAGFGYGLLPGGPVDDMFRAKDVTGSKNLADVAAKVASIPLKFQPGEGWSYSIGVDLQARIVEVITGKAFGAFLQERILGPLKMTDTAFYVHPDKVARFADFFALDPRSGKVVPIPPGFAPQLSNFTDPDRLESGGAGLVSTAGDYRRFCQMILNGGQLDGVRILQPRTISLMGQNVVRPGVKFDNGLVATMGTSAFHFGEGVGFGLDFLVITDPTAAKVPVGKGTISWGGAAGTWFWIDPKNDLFFIGMIQRWRGSSGMEDLPDLSQRLVYQALKQPEK
ncbi:serine hydrolase domain-containing protein [Novosphingobium sp. PASSN1]|uniref:serine hydrolase domain-containing protein n=1 Tax=Novosphingobium sp. PASSN1 TaxID=2015561 RepID=UPI0025FA71FF|nr:serine hydrolase domain-containing protein [Novosphingobium sp. PASSN1]